MLTMPEMLKSINETSFGDLGSLVNVKNGHWVIGGDSLFPLQIEMLAEDNRYLLYSSAIRSTAEPIYVSLMKTMFIENLQGMSLGRYGICLGLVTITIYQQIKLDQINTNEKLAAMMTCHRMLMECYLEGDATMVEDLPYSPLLSMMNSTVIPFRH